VPSLLAQQQLAGALIDMFGRLALEAGPKVSASARKNFATAYGIATDKLAALQGRPTQILRVEEAETQRPAVWDLVRRLAEVPRDTTVESEQPRAAESTG
jgi:hypothetical protein